MFTTLSEVRGSSPEASVHAGLYWPSRWTTMACERRKRKLSRDHLRLPKACVMPTSEDVQQDPHTASGSSSSHCRGEGLHGCQHYRRRCKLVAPCCGEVFACRHCHNDEKQAGESVRACHLERRPRKCVGPRRLHNTSFDLLQAGLLQHCALDRLSQCNPADQGLRFTGCLISLVHSATLQLAHDP